MFSLQDLWQAYLSCRRRKRGTRDAQRFDQALIEHLVEMRQALADRQWRPRRANWFVTTRPKAREVHCADFADRVVHHWLVPRLESLFEPVFIHDSHSNRVGHGVHHAVDRLQKHVRKASRNGRCQAWYLQLDIANFFCSIDRSRLYALIKRRVARLVEGGALERLYARELLWLTGRILSQQPGDRACYIGAPGRQQRVPAHKRLSLAPPGFGLAIGNLPSQLFANIYLNEMDQFIKHGLKIRGYVRYVDDFVLVSADRRQLERARERIVEFLAQKLDLSLRDSGRLAPVACGIDFLGYVVRPHYRLVRRRVVQHWQEKLHDFRRRLWQRSARGLALNLSATDAQALRACNDSYLGHFRHASSWSLSQRLMTHNPWLAVLFHLADGPRLQPLWQPCTPTGLRSQWRWIRQHWPECLVLMQVGNQFECYQEQAGILTDMAGQQRARWINRRPFSHAAAAGLGRLAGLRRVLRHQGVAHAFIAEQGHLRGGLKRRVLRLAWWPAATAPMI